MYTKHLVLGYKGQVGSAIYRALLRNPMYEVSGIDVAESTGVPRPVDVLHCCIPFSADFYPLIVGYRRDYMVPGGLTIIHSTVPLGTSRDLDAVHSPIRGVHPNLLAGVLNFVKIFGGDRAEEAAEVFQHLGITTSCTPKSETTEALKLWDTTYYGLCIAFEKEVHQYCIDHDLDFNIVYTLGNQTYNQGYAKLGRYDVQRPVLEHHPGRIGGHCVVPNAHLLGGPVADFILDTDYKQEKKS